MTGDCKLSILIQILLFVRRNSAKCNNKLIKYTDEGANLNQNMKKFSHFVGNKKSFNLIFQLKAWDKKMFFFIL